MRGSNCTHISDCQDSEQQSAIRDAEEKLQKNHEQMEKLKEELKKADSKKPSQVLETLVVKLKKQASAIQECGVPLRDIECEVLVPCALGGR